MRPHLGLDVTAEESALLRGFSQLSDDQLAGAPGAHPRGNRVKDPNIPRTPSPVYHYENKSMFDDFGEARGGAIPEDRPMHTADEPSAARAGGFASTLSAPGQPPPRGPPPQGAPHSQSAADAQAQAFLQLGAAAQMYPHLAMGSGGMSNPYATLGMGYPDYYNMMLNPLAVQQAAAAAAATMTLQQSMKDANPFLSPTLYSQSGSAGGGYGESIYAEKPQGKGKGGGNKGGGAAADGGKGGKKGGGKDDRKKRKEVRKAAMPAPADDLDDALSQPVPDGASEHMRMLRHQGNRCRLTIREMSDAKVIAEFAIDQFGSRYLHSCLDSASDEDTNLVFMKLLPQAVELTTDVFGNFVLQKLLEIGSVEVKRVFAEQLVGDVLRLSLHAYGCRVIQKVLEEVSTDQQVLLVNEMKNNVVKLIEDQNGNHVVQKCIERLPPEKVAFIVEELRTNVDKMAMHCYGCRVVQRVLEHCLPAQTKGILEELVQNLLSLFRDQYGNYVVQHILEHGRPVDRERILDLVKQMPLELSCHKFASNVVEKGLLLGDARERSVIIRAIIGDPREPQRLQMMVRDRFANYVVQRLLDVAEQSQKEEVFWILKDAATVTQLKKTSYGKHILGKLEQIATQVAPSAVSQFSTYSP